MLITMERCNGSAGGDVKGSERRSRLLKTLPRNARSDRKENPQSEKYEVSQGSIATAAGPSGFHLLAILHFDYPVAIQRAFASAEGQAAATDVRTFATGGADMLLFDSREV
jgi:uncharacterized protein (TIGR02118 family)